MSELPILETAQIPRFTQHLPKSSLYRCDYISVPDSPHQDVQGFLLNSARQFENSKMEASMHPTLHFTRQIRVLKPRNIVFQQQVENQRLMKRSARNIQVRLYPMEDSQKEQCFGGLMSQPKSIRLRMYHKNEMISRDHEEGNESNHHENGNVDQEEANIQNENQETHVQIADDENAYQQNAKSSESDTQQNLVSENQTVEQQQREKQYNEIENPASEQQELDEQRQQQIEEQNQEQDQS